MPMQSPISLSERFGVEEEAPRDRGSVSVSPTTLDDFGGISIDHPGVSPIVKDLVKLVGGDMQTMIAQTRTADALTTTPGNAEVEPGEQHPVMETTETADASETFDVSQTAEHKGARSRALGRLKETASSLYSKVNAYLDEHPAARAALKVAGVGVAIAAAFGGVSLAGQGGETLLGEMTYEEIGYGTYIVGQIMKWILLGVGAFVVLRAIVGFFRRYH